MTLSLQKKENTLRVPPHNIEAEQAVLGCVLIDSEAFTKILEILAHDGSDFYHPVHKEIFRGMVELFEKNVPTDTVTIIDSFKDITSFDAVGGISYIRDIAEATPTAANVAYYADIVKEKSVLRRLITASIDIADRGYRGGESIDEFLDDAERIIFQVAQEKGKKSYYSMKELAGHAFETIEQLYEKKTSITGIPTGYKDLDRLTSGFQKSDLIILAGRPGMGKTAFALNIAEHVAVEEKIPVVVFSLEMSKEQLTQRLLSSRAKVDLQRLRNGRLKDEDWTSLTTAVGTLYEAPIYIDDTPALTALEIRAKARRWKVELGVELIIVDYLQLMRATSRTDSREQEISYISRSLKALAKELNIPVIALSQLSRRTEQREGNRPQLSDLRESGAIEQDADVVAFVYRQAAYKDCDCPKDLCTCGVRRSAELIVAKQRNGPTDDIPLTFMREIARFEDQTQVDYGDPEGGWVE
ncbi:MAG: replicative DNA helicase [Deltaproteobacteria bacterium]|nr:replicative DNA helicase [Deltaproteobacteria bacterium]